MGLEIDKQEIKQTNKPILSGVQSGSEVLSEPLSAAEAESLTSGLAGDESAVLEENSGKNNSEIQAGSFPSIAGIIVNYPNIANVHVASGMLTFVDNENNIITDSNGKPLTIKYGNPENLQTFNLVEFYLGHINNEVNLQKLIELQNLQTKLLSTPETDENYPWMQTAAETQKMQILGVDERKEYATNKLLNTYNKNDFNSWLSTIAAFYCAEEKINISPENNINSLYPILFALTSSPAINILHQISDSNTDEAKKRILMAELLKTVLEIIKTQSFDTNPEMETPNFEALKTVNPLIEAIVEKYYTNASSDNKKNTSPELEEYTQLTPIELRSKISKIETLELLNSVGELINKMPYTKAEKQMLLNECIKQRGKCQLSPNMDLRHTKDLPQTENDFEEGRIKSSVAFALFKKCKTPLQREMARLILSDKRLYNNQQNLELIINKILESCKNQADVYVKKQLVSNILENEKLIDNGHINNELYSCIAESNSDIIGYQIKLLDAYKNSGSKLSPEEFSFLLAQLNKDNAPEIEKQLLDLMQKRNEFVRYPADSNNTEAPEKEFVVNFIKNGYNEKAKEETPDEKQITTIIHKDKKMYEEFTQGRICTDDNLYDLYKYSQITYAKTILNNLCPQQQYSADNIIKILKCTSEKTVDLTKQILDKKEISASDKVTILSAINENPSQIELIKLILSKKDINVQNLPKILKSVKQLGWYSADINRNEIDFDNIEKSIQLLKNPNTSESVVKLLNSGWDLKTISDINSAKLQYYADKNDKLADVKNPDKRFFMCLGLNRNEADEVLNAISKGGTISEDMKQTAIDLLRSGTPAKKIGEVLASSSSAGKYNIKMNADSAAISNLKIDEFLKRYLPVANNHSEGELAAELSQDSIKQLTSMIRELPKSVKASLRAKGFNIEGIIDKLLAARKQNSRKNEKQSTILKS